MYNKLMFKKISLLLLSLFTLFSIMIPIITFSNKNNEEIVNINSNRSIKDNYFYEYIKDSATNGVPNIIFARDATLPIQQIFYYTLGSIYYREDQGLEINDKNEFTHILSYENFKDKININAIKRISNIDVSIDNINENNVKAINIILNNKGYKYILEIMSKILKKFNYIDFIFSDADFFDIMENHYNILEKIIRHANKILIVSDGAYHTKTYITFLQKILIKELFSREQIIHSLYEFRKNNMALNNNLIVNLLSLKNYESLNENSKFHFISHINYDSYQNTIKPYWNVNVFDTSFYNYAQYLFTKEATKNKFLNTFSNLFLFNINTMNDIMINGYDTYDKNKRNAIFLGSSLFAKDNNSNITRLENFPNITLAVRKQMDELLNKFPNDQYNIIFKLHPVYNGENAIKYIQYITDNKIINPIIINPKIPLEVLISNDYYWHKNNLNNNNLESFIFRENEIYNPKEWTTYFGLQPSTTAIHTTRLFYESTFNISKYESASLISMENFPIPVMFSTLHKMKKDNYYFNYSKENIEIINNIYKFYNPSIYFKDNNLKKWDNFIINNFIIGVNTLKDYSWFILLAIVFSIAIFITSFICLKKIYRKNLLKSYKRIKLIKI